MEKPWAVGKEDGSVDPSWFATEREANQEIIRLDRIDPVGVAHGEYYIEGPGTSENTRERRYKKMPEKKHLFSIITTDSRGQIKRKFLKYDTSDEKVTDAFIELSDFEAAGSEPLIPKNGSFSVGIVEFTHPSGIEEI